MACISGIVPENPGRLAGKHMGLSNCDRVSVTM